MERENVKGSNGRCRDQAIFLQAVTWTGDKKYGARFSKSSLPKTGRPSMEKGPGEQKRGASLIVSAV